MSEENEPRKLPDTIGNSLGLTPVDAVLAPVDLNTEIATGKSYQDSDKTIDNVIAAGTFALQDLCDKTSQATGRDAGSMHRVIAEMMNAMTNAAKAKMEIRAMEAKIVQANMKPEGPETVNNTLVMTTDELYALIKSKKDNEA